MSKVSRWKVAAGGIGAVASVIAIYQFITGDNALTSQPAREDIVLGEWLSPLPLMREHGTVIRLQFYEDGAVLMSVQNMPRIGGSGFEDETFTRCSFDQERHRVRVTCDGEVFDGTIAGDILSWQAPDETGVVRAMTFRRSE